MKKQQQQQNFKRQSGSAFYDEYKDIAEIRESPVAFIGRLKVNPRRRKVAFVTCEGISIDIIIDDEK